MKTVTRFLTGAAAAAALTVAAASPAQAQFFGSRHYNDDGIDAGDIITGVAVLGGIAAIASAFNRDGSLYGYGNRYRYRNDYRNAVNACAFEAERFGRGRVHVLDVDRRGYNSYRVRGVIEGSRYGGYDRYDRYDYFGRGGYDPRVSFACTARGNGRITDFDLGRRY